MKRVFISVILLIILPTVSSIAGSTWLRKRTYYIYEYIYDGEIIQQFEVPNRNGPSNNPIFYANCVINKINLGSDEEGRFFASDKVDIYCGKKPVVTIAGHFESGVSRTNLFGETVVEAKDKSWVVFLPSNDGDVPGYAYLRSNGELSLVQLVEYGIISYFTPEQIVTMEDRVVLKVSAFNPENKKQDKRSGAKLIIFKDGSYKMDFNNH